MRNYFVDYLLPTHESLKSTANATYCFGNIVEVSVMISAAWNIKVNNKICKNLNL